MGGVGWLAGDMPVSVAAHHLFVVTACQDVDYSTLLQEYCLAPFQLDMEAAGRTVWCDWEKTMR